MTITCERTVQCPLMRANLLDVSHTFAINRDFPIQARADKLYVNLRMGRMLEIFNCLCCAIISLDMGSKPTQRIIRCIRLFTPEISLILDNLSKGNLVSRILHNMCSFLMSGIQCTSFPVIAKRQCATVAVLSTRPDKSIKFLNS